MCLRGFVPLSALVLIAATAAASAEPCRGATFAHQSYIVCDFTLPDDDLRLFWLHPDGSPYNTFGALSQTLEAGGRKLAFAMNGGMYGEDFSPVGLYVENGKQLARANTRNVAASEQPVPNFYKKPNGVFYFGRDGAGVMTTERFLARKPRADFATQSGPMLLIDGAIHPAFIPDSTDRKRRNGVGVTDGNEVHFVISEDEVSFQEFAVFFRDGLGIRSALFLDGGTAPALYAPELFRNDPPGHGGFGPIIAVVGKP